MDEEQVVVEEQPVVERLTVEDVQSAVEGALSNYDAHDVAIDELANTVVEIRDNVALLRSAESEEEQKDGEEVTYTVRLDSSQVETAKVAARVVCTEGLMVMILLALLCGLQVWQILGGRWSRG